MKKRVLAALAVAALATLAAVLPRTRRVPALAQPVSAGGARRAAQVRGVPGLRLETSEVVTSAEGRQSLHVKVKNVSGKRLVGYTLFATSPTNTVFGVSFDAPAGEFVEDERQLDTTTPLEFFNGLPVSVAAVFEDGEAQGPDDDRLHYKEDYAADLKKKRGGR